jgi:hypothetical protein
MHQLAEADRLLDPTTGQAVAFTPVRLPLLDRVIKISERIAKMLGSEATGQG